MEGIIANNEPERRLSVPLWPWGLFAGFVFVCFIILGFVGIVLAVFDGHILYSNIPFYIQAVTSSLAIIVAMAETGLIVSAIKWFKAVNQQKMNHGTYGNSSSERSVTNSITTSFTCPHIIVLYFCFLGINAGLSIMFWSLTLVYDYRHNYIIEGTIWPFLFVDISLGVLAPLLIISSLVPLLKIIRHTTNHQMETRKLYSWCLSFMGYDKGSKGCYWTINDSFHFKIEENFFGGLNTVLVFLLAVTVFMNCWLYLINSAIVDQYGVEYCNVLTEQEKLYSYCFDLYSNRSAMYINCSSNLTYSEGPLFCFQFKLIGQNVAPVQILVTTTVLYYISSTSISAIFQIVNGLLYYTQTQVWSYLVMLLGVTVWVIGIVSVGSVYYIHNNFDILAILQLLTIGIAVMIVGLLLKRGNPMFTHRNNRESIALTPLNHSGLTVQESTEIVPQRAVEESTQTNNRSTFQVEVGATVTTEQETELNSTISSMTAEPRTDDTNLRYSSQTITVTPSLIEGYNILTHSTDLFHQSSLTSHASSSTAGRGYSTYALQGPATVGRRKVTIL